MKSKLAILALLAVCLWGREVHADTVVDISATWCTSCRPGIGMPVDFQAQATVEPVTGTLFNIGFNFLFTGSGVLEVTGISGTLNGSPISFLQAPQGMAPGCTPIFSSVHSASRRMASPVTCFGTEHSLPL
jgi:hypothetical protein